jgi:cysteine desulfurase/selenocysteine lyase
VNVDHGPQLLALGDDPAAALDARSIRRVFPIFERLVNGEPLSYLDSAATAQKPWAVIQAMTDLYTTSYANVHRGVYALAEESTAAVETSREKVRALLNAESTDEIVFTRNATEGLNLVAFSWGRTNVTAGDVIVTTETEHHSNLVPWQVLARETGAKLRYLRLGEDGMLDLEPLAAIAAEGPVRLVAVAEQSNAFGTLNDVGALISWAHEQGAVAVIDACQSVPHRPVDVRALDADFLAFSGHKLCGPSGAGALYGKREHLTAMPPFLTGGEMISAVRLDRTSWNALPYKFEAGTPAIAEIVGMGAAIDYLTAIGLDRIAEHERRITDYACDRLAEVPGLRILGPADRARRGGIVSFDLEGAHPHDVAQILDRRGVCVRAGHHCAQPAMAAAGVSATTRASFYLYSVPEEIDRLVDGLEDVRTLFTLRA